MNRRRADRKTRQNERKTTHIFLGDVVRLSKTLSSRFTVDTQDSASSKFFSVCWIWRSRLSPSLILLIFVVVVDDEYFRLIIGVLEGEMSVSVSLATLTANCTNNIWHRLSGSTDTTTSDAVSLIQWFSAPHSRVFRFLWRTESSILKTRRHRSSIWMIWCMAWCGMGHVFFNGLLHFREICDFEPGR